MRSIKFSAATYFGAVGYGLFMGAIGFYGSTNNFDWLITTALFVHLILSFGLIYNPGTLGGLSAIGAILGYAPQTEISGGQGPEKAIELVSSLVMHYAMPITLTLLSCYFMDYGSNPGVFVGTILLSIVWWQLCITHKIKGGETYKNIHTGILIVFTILMVNQYTLQLPIPATKAEIASQYETRIGWIEGVAKGDIRVIPEWITLQFFILSMIMYVIVRILLKNTHWVIRNGIGLTTAVVIAAIVNPYISNATGNTRELMGVGATKSQTEWRYHDTVKVPLSDGGKWTYRGILPIGDLLLVAEKSPLVFYNRNSDGSRRGAEEHRINHCGRGETTKGYRFLHYPEYPMGQMILRMPGVSREIPFCEKLQVSITEQTRLLTLSNLEKINDKGTDIRAIAGIGEGETTITIYKMVDS